MVTIGIPRIKRPRQTKLVNKRLRGRRYSGHMSTTPVTKLSTRQNSLSIPIVWEKTKSRYTIHLEIFIFVTFLPGLYFRILQPIMHILVTISSIRSAEIINDLTSFSIIQSDHSCPYVSLLLGTAMGPD